MEKLSTRWNWRTVQKYFISLSYEHFRLFPSGMFFSSPELFIFFFSNPCVPFSFRSRHSKLKSGHNESHFHCSITKLMNERIWNISKWNKSFVLKTSKNYNFYIDKWISNGTSILHSVFLFLLHFHSTCSFPPFCFAFSIFQMVFRCFVIVTHPSNVYFPSFCTLFTWLFFCILSARCYKVQTVSFLSMATFKKRSRFLFSSPFVFLFLFYFILFCYS